MNYTINPYQQQDLLDAYELEMLFDSLEESEDEEEFRLFDAWYKEQKRQELQWAVSQNIFTPAGRKSTLRIMSRYLSKDVAYLIFLFAGSILEVPFPYERKPKLLLPCEVLKSFEKTMNIVAALRYWKFNPKDSRSWVRLTNESDEGGCIRVLEGGECMYIQSRTILQISSGFCISCGELAFPKFVHAEFTCNCGFLGHKDTFLKGGGLANRIGNFCYLCARDNSRFINFVLLSTLGAQTQVGF